MDDIFRGVIAVLYYWPPVYFLVALWKLRNSHKTYSKPPLIFFWIFCTLLVFVSGVSFNEPIMLSAGEGLNGLLNIIILFGFLWPLWDILRHNKKQIWKAVLPLISIAILISAWDGRGLLAMEWWYLAPQGFTIPVIYWFWPRSPEHAS